MKTTTTKLPEKSVNWLQDLIQVNIDSRDGFKEAADNLQKDHASLAAVFRNLSSDRGQQAAELQAMVAVEGESPTKSGSVTAAAHRGWMDLRAALGGGEQAILSEAERGEDHIKAKYEAAIKDLVGCDCVSTLERHYSAVRESHDQVRDLRDAKVVA